MTKPQADVCFKQVNSKLCSRWCGMSTLKIEWKFKVTASLLTVLLEICGYFWVDDPIALSFFKKW